VALGCPACWHRQRFDGPSAGQLRAEILRHAAGLCEAGEGGGTGGGEAFAERLRRERVGPGDEVALLLRLADRGGRRLPPVSRPVEVLVTVPVGPAGSPRWQAQREAAGLYLETLIDAVRASLRDLPTGWFFTEEHPGVEVKIEGVALAVTRG
jgi:hypothetical protein